MPTGFEKGSPLHVVTVLACFAAVGVAVWLGRRWRDRAPGRERAFRLGWVVFLVVQQITWQVWQNLPGYFDLRYTLPLHLCDLVVWAVPFALLARSRLARSLLYFWGIGLSIFAFLMPILADGPARLNFWMFWLGHTQIIGSAAYLTAVLRFRPSAGDVGVAFLATCGYVALILPFDARFGLDYGNVGPDPSATWMFGPWPLRVVVVVALEGVLFVLLWLPWAIGRSSGE